jgi:SpoVK/Ycf46/Vps4 family AAA+-type ATPase
MEPYRDSFEHLRHEIQRIDLLLHRAVQVARSPEHPGPGQEYKGLVISEGEIDEMLESGDFMSMRWRHETELSDVLGPIDDKLGKLRAEIDERRAASLANGTRLNLPFLAQQFGLSEAEVDLLLIALAPELEPRYHTLFAYLQDDVTRKGASVDLSLNLICRAEREKLFARRLLGPGSPLVHYQLLRLEDEPQDRQASFCRKFLKIAPPVLRFLLDELPDSSESGPLTAAQADAVAAELSDATETALHGVIESLLRQDKRQNAIRLRGTDPAALGAAAQLVAAAFNRDVLSFDLTLAETDPTRLLSAIRDAAMFDALPAISSPEPPPGEAGAKLAQAEQQLWSELVRTQEPVALLGPPAAFTNAPADAAAILIWPVDVSGPEFARRQQAWSQSLSVAGVTADASALADAFHFGGGRIRQAVNLAVAAAAVRDPSNPQPAQQDFANAGRSLSTPNLARFALPIAPRCTWSDVVLPDDKMAQLHAIVSRVRHRRQVLDLWGFGQKLARGKGSIALFSGAPGTGKTTCAEAMANNLGLNLFQIDLSTVVSKYIGETESNLGAIFREAENTSTLLFFDEADALFTKRTEVKDALDRYANQEVNYLLQRVEQYEGMVILATNLQKNIDEAFLRRMQFVVDFPMPGEEQRLKIWNLQFPKDAPRDPAIDLAFLAKQCKVSGGTIHNVVMSAAFAAADEGVPISMRHLVTALRMETLKEGKLLMKSDLGKYFDLAQPPTASTAATRVKP